MTSRRAFESRSAFVSALVGGVLPAAEGRAAEVSATTASRGFGRPHRD